jgi:class 3 adenylate cyclase/CheY-like chemotaxis protein
MAAPKDEPGSRLLHDLRTPLNQIIGYSEMLEEEAQDLDQPAFVDTLRKIASAGRGLSALLEEAFGVARRTTQDPAPESFPVEALEATPDAATPREGRLLVVDDNEMNRDLLSRRLSARGYTVALAQDGTEALERIDAEPFDLVLLDVMMPGLSGFDVLKIVRGKHSRGDLPIIMVTAKDQSEDIVHALRLGANDYVTKPIDFAVALARTDAHLSLKRATHEIRRLAQGLELRNQFIRATFGRYLSDDIVAGLLEGSEGLQLGGHKRDVTILMSDLRGFTSVTEGLAPEAVVGILNSYLGAMVDVITKHHGTIDEFIGDAILVLFGAPVARGDDARRAVACALEMQLAMVPVNERFRREWLPEVEMGIAVNTGPVVVGNIGSAKRTKYGVVGSHVNLTGRIESFTVGGQILISEHTLAAAGPGVQVGREMTIQAKGFKEPIKVFELTGIGGEYGLFLSERRYSIVALETPLAVRYTIAEDKAVGGPPHVGSLVGVGEGIAELRPERPLRLFTNLQMRLQGASGEEVPGDVYGKVADIPSDGDSVLVRFTSLPRGVRRFLRDLAASSQG